MSSPPGVLRSVLSSPTTTPSSISFSDQAPPSQLNNPSGVGTSASTVASGGTRGGTSFSDDRSNRPFKSSSRRSLSFQRSRTVSSGEGGNEKSYRNRVGFDTFDDCHDDGLFSFTLQTQSEGYHRSRESRTFLVAVSRDESGSEALDWLMENLLEDGDEMVALRVIEWDETERASSEKKEDLREEARELQRLILEKNDDGDERKISIIVEFVAGRKTESIMRLVALYRPDSLIVGTRGSRGKLAEWGAALGAPGMGSVSRYCISHSAVPVIVVRPEAKVKKSMAKREKDPKRKSYLALLGTSGTAGTNLSRSRSAGGLA
ncbi:UspA [Phaffia rhodozyma]|uniref:UspA n=1 Tax=Phaffia rhodozyma TaxID=264483 RepID=A0A0F7SSK8_PHARH|nr:UspA [Phaffia rhodozyma]